MKRGRIEGTIRQMFENKHIEGIEFRTVKKTSDDKSPSLELVLPYVSQVAAESGKEHTDSISLDINFANKIGDKIGTLPIRFNPEYDIRISLQKGAKDAQARIKVLTMEEIIAEKMHAILNRKKPRDVYDLWYLLKHNVGINWQLVDSKLKLFKMEYRYQEFEDAVRSRKTEWQRDMAIVLVEPPQFEEVSGFVLSEFRKAEGKRRVGD